MEREELRRRLKAVCANRDVIAAGRMQIINLAPIRDRMGESWDRLADKIDLITRRVIERRLSPVDVFVPLEGLGYVVLFGRLDRNEAKLKVEAIAREIAQHLIGDAAGDDTDILRTVVVDIDKQVLSQAGNDPSLLAKAFAMPRIDAKPSEGPEVLLRRPKRLPGGPLHVRTIIDTVYRPIWDVRHGALSTFLCALQIIHENDDGSSSSVLTPHDPTLSKAETNLFLLDHGLTLIENLLSRNRKILVATSLHYETLADNAARTAVIERLRDLPEDGRRYLILELLDCLPHVPPFRLDQLTAPLRPLCRSLTARVPRSDFGMPTIDIKSLGINVLSVDYSGASGQDEKKALEQINKFVERSQDKGMVTVAYGMDTISMAVGAAAAGVTFIEGAAVQEPLSNPEKIRRFAVSDLYASFEPPDGKGGRS